MKRGLITLITIMALFGSMSVMAQEADCAIDPDWKQSKINDTLEACKTQSPKAVAENVNQYAEIAKGVAEAMGVAAKEIGIATNEFVKTDAGKITVALIIWQVAGDELKGIIFGIPLLLFAVWLFFKLRDHITRTGEYDTVQSRFFMGEKRVPRHDSIGELNDSQYIMLALSGVMCAILTLIAFLHIIG
jgi:hypothetical protein